MRHLLLLLLAGCTAQAGIPGWSSGGAGGGAAAWTCDDCSLADCQAETPDPGRVCIPNDSPYTLVARASEWKYYYPGIGADVTPPPSTGWSWLNQGTATITTTGGMERLAGPAETYNNGRIRYRARPSDPTATPYYCEAGMRVNWWGTGGSGTGAVLVGFTDGTGNASIRSEGALTQVARGADAGLSTIDAAVALTPPTTLCRRIEETATVRKFYVGDCGSSWYQVGGDYGRTVTITATSVLFGVGGHDADLAQVADLFHWECGSL